LQAMNFLGGQTSKHKRTINIQYLLHFMLFWSRERNNAQLPFYIRTAVFLHNKRTMVSVFKMLNLANILHSSHFNYGFMPFDFYLYTRISIILNLYIALLFIVVEKSYFILFVEYLF
jgi:hypothetical protein